mgnify:CR=1 FL=1
MEKYYSLRVGNTGFVMGREVAVAMDVTDGDGTGFPPKIRILAVDTPVVGVLSNDGPN